MKLPPRAVPRPLFPWRPLLLCGLGWLGGCGGEGSSPEAPDKTVPELPFLYEGRSLEAWKSLPPGGSEEEAVAQAFALAALERDPQASESLLRALLADERVSVELAATVAAGRLQIPSAPIAQRLVELLDVPEEPLRRHARQALGELGPVAVDALRPALADGGLRVRWGALVAAGALGEAGAPLIADVAHLVVASREEAAVRRQALFTLPRLGPEGLARAIGFLRSDETSIRQETAAGLVALGAGAVPPVAELLGDPDEILAAVAAGILSDLGPRAEVALPDLVGALRRAGVVRFNAAEALVSIGAPARAVLQALREDPDEDLAATAAYALEQIRRNEAPR